MWTRDLLKQNGKIAFKRNYWTCVLVSLILALAGGGFGGGSGESEAEFNVNIDGGSAAYRAEAYEVLRYVLMYLPIIIIATVIGIAVGLALVSFVTNIIEIGGKRYFMENREHKTTPAQVLYGFTNGYYMNGVKIMFAKNLYIFGWSLLFLVPGIIKSFSYMMIPYIIAENPQISKGRAFDISMQMMEGHKMEAFVLGLSFIGWDLLSAFTVGIVGAFYVNPYKHATYAEFYTAVKTEAIARGITDAIELPGVSIPEFTEQFES